MPNPTRRDMHVSTPLRDLTIGAANADADFVLEEACPFADVDKKIDQYYVYDIGSWNRIEMQPRGPSERSHQAGWTLSTDNYECDRNAVNHPYDWTDSAEADDAIVIDQDASDYLGQQVKLFGEKGFGDTVMQAAVWTTDFDGAGAKAYGSSQVLYWDNASADPQEDHYFLRGTVKSLCGKIPNVMVVGYDVLAALVANAVVRDAIKHTSETTGAEVEAKLAKFFNVEKFLVAGAFYNSAAEGATDSIGFIVPSDSVWCGWVDKSVGKRIYTACRTFASKEKGRAKNGIVTRQWEEIAETSTISEVETFWDHKIVAAAAAYFIDDVLT